MGTVIEYIWIEFLCICRQYDFKIGCRLVLNPLMNDALLKIEILINHISGFHLTLLNHIWIVFSFDQITLDVRQTFFTDVKIIISVFECGYVI